MLTLLSVLAVLWSAHAPAHDVQPCATASSAAPSTAQWLTQGRSSAPAPASPLLGAPPEPLRWQKAGVRRASGLPHWNAPKRPTDLSWWGRQQTDGG